MNDNKATILKFPESKIVRINPDIDAGGERQKLADKNLSDNITANLIIGFVLDNLEQVYGIDIDDPEFAKYFSFVANIFQATMYKYYGVPHHLHKFIDESVKLVEETPPIMEEVEQESE